MSKQMNNKERAKNKKIVQRDKLKYKLSYKPKKMIRKRE